MNRDGTNNVEVVESVRPAVHTDTDGEAVDLQGADAALIACSVGAIAGTANASTLIKLQESDASGSGYTDVAAADIIGTQPTTLTANTIYQFAYLGSKRYVRAVVADGGATSVAASCVVVKSYLSRAPAGYSESS